MKRVFSRACAAVGAAALLVVSTSLAGPVVADDIHNDVDGTIDATAETISLTAGGATRSVTLAVLPTGEGKTPEDGKSGCNLTGSTTLVVDVLTSSASVATVSPSSLTFTSCDDLKVLTVTPLATGSTTISLSQSNSTASTFNTAPATFTVNVASATPPNTAPSVSVPASPYHVEATSATGAVVSYAASAADAQDEPDPTPLCAPPSGAVFPIGSTVVTCSATDSGGLSDSESFTVVVRDSTDPTISVATGAVAGGTDWYNIASSGTAGIVATVTASDAVGVTDVACTDNGAASDLDLGAPVTLTDGVHDIACTATDGAGNGASDSKEFKVDQTAPTMSALLSPAVNANGWNNTDVTVTYTCADATSDLDEDHGNNVPTDGCWAPDSVTTNGLTSFHRSVVDVAGNVAEYDFDVRRDAEAPTISGVATPPANANGWNNTNVSVTFACFDGLSTLASCDGDTTLTDEGAGQEVTGTAADKAGNTNSDTVGPVNIDKTAPTIGVTRTEANAAGWNNGAVAVTFTCSDGLSRVDTLSDLVVLDQEGAGQTATGSCTDKAGNTSTVTVEDINIDTTKPTITGGRTPAANENGWNNGDVTVFFSCTEGGPSGIATNTVAGGTLTAEGEDQSVTSAGECVDAAGNAADAATVGGISIDKTSPVISGSASPAPNAAGWNNTDVAVSFTCDESGTVQSGIGTDTVAGETLTADGADQSVTSSGQCVDRAGNAAAPATVSKINIDTTEPTISGGRTPAANENGWNNGDVTVSFTCNDGGPSGIATNTVTGGTLTAEGADQSVTSTGECVDAAGNAADAATVDGVNIDKTSPVISGSASPAPNAAGWNNTDVAVSFACDESGAVQSGIGTDTVAGETLTADGADQSVTSSGQCVDEAGNAADAATVGGIDIDKTAPAVTVTVTPNPVVLNGPVSATGAASDALSGVVGSAGCGPVSSAAVGTQTVTCTAVDAAGNTGSGTATYGVVYDWNGFFQPIDNTPVGGAVVFNKAKAGQSIPAKFSLGGNQGLNIIAAGYPTFTQVACTQSAEDLIEAYAASTANNGLVYDATANQYNYVWKTQSTWANTCRKFDLMLVDGTHHVAYFKFTK